MSKEEQPRGDRQNAVDSPIELLFETLALSPLYGPLLAPAIRKRQFERSELQRREEIAQGEFERKVAEIRAGKEAAEPKLRQKYEKPLRKSVDLSTYLDAAGLTNRQRECLSLKYEYGCTEAGIARLLGKNRKTIDEHIVAGERKLNTDRIQGIARKKRSKVKPDEFD